MVAGVLILGGWRLAILGHLMGLISGWMAGISWIWVVRGMGGRSMEGFRIMSLMRRPERGRGFTNAREGLCEGLGSWRKQVIERAAVQTEQSPCGERSYEGAWIWFLGHRLDDYLHNGCVNRSYPHIAAVSFSFFWYNGTQQSEQDAGGAGVRVVRDFSGQACRISCASFSLP